MLLEFIEMSTSVMELKFNKKREWDFTAIFIKDFLFMLLGSVSKKIIILILIKNNFKLIN